jgi:hypothetical protein
MMRGHIKKRYENSYTIVLNLGRDPVTGKRKQQWIAVKGTKKDAERRLAELLHQIDSGAFIEPARTTLHDYLERWLKDYVQPNLSPRSAEGYEHIMRKHLMPALGNITLTQLKAEHLQRYYSEKISSGLSNVTIRHHHTLIHKALDTAVVWGILPRNVADSVTTPGRGQAHTVLCAILYSPIYRYEAVGTAGIEVERRRFHIKPDICEPQLALSERWQGYLQADQDGQG